VRRPLAEQVGGWRDCGEGLEHVQMHEIETPGSKVHGVPLSTVGNAFLCSRPTTPHGGYADRECEQGLRGATELQQQGQVRLSVDSPTERCQAHGFLATGRCGRHHTYDCLSESTSQSVPGPPGIIALV
jgi:hypothetical protein